MADFQPPPTYALPILVDEKTGKAQFNPIWLKWFVDLAQVLNDAGGTVIGDVVGPGSSTDNAVARWDGTTGTLLADSGVIIDDSNNVSGIVNLTTTGNVQLGDASADTLTINAGTWTIGSNYTATRAAGTVAAGSVTPIVNAVTFTGDAGGTTSIRGFIFQSTSQGANNIATHRAEQVAAIHNGSGVLTDLNALLYNVSIEGTGNVTNATGVISAFATLAGAAITNANMFSANVPVMTSGTVTTFNGFRALNLGNASITTAVGFKIDDFTSSTTMRGIQSSLSSGSGKHNLYIDGTADNSFAGPIYPAQDSKTIQTASAIYAGTGAPNNANGSDGDFYFRSDGGVLTTIYQRRAGAWVGVV